MCILPCRAVDHASLVGYRYGGTPACVLAISTRVLVISVHTRAPKLSTRTWTRTRTMSSRTHTHNCCTWNKSSSRLKITFISARIHDSHGVTMSATLWSPERTEGLLSFITVIGNLRWFMLKLQASMLHSSVDLYLCEFNNTKATVQSASSKVEWYTCTLKG